MVKSSKLFILSAHITNLFLNGNSFVSAIVCAFLSSHDKDLSGSLAPLTKLAISSPNSL